MKKILANCAFFALVTAAPAFGDVTNSITLVIENDAGMVTQLTDMTQRECDAVMALMAPRQTWSTSTAVFQSYTVTGGMSGTIYPPKSTTSKMTSVKCVVSTDKKPGQ